MCLKSVVSTMWHSVGSIGSHSIDTWALHGRGCVFTGDFFLFTVTSHKPLNLKITLRDILIPWGALFYLVYI